MIEILSLPRRYNINTIQVKNVVFKSGLPINALPGWESIPLNCKLPMLKCPDNQVIFSKDKIGQSFKHLKQEFDPSGRENLREYNPLHDSNLKTFYSNERNLKRLRENGEITQNNDVICTLKDFNEYRQQLHKTQLYIILQELNRIDTENHDRMLIANAESITSRDHDNLMARQHSYAGILERKKQIETARAQHFKQSWQRIEQRFQRIAHMKEMKRISLEYRKILNELKMQQHWEACVEDRRRQLIHLKKVFQFKKDRLKKNKKIIMEQRANKTTQASVISWQKRLHERIEQQKKVKALLEEADIERWAFIMNHRNLYKSKWAKIEQSIKERARMMALAKKPKVKRRRKRKPPPPPPMNYQDIFDKMVNRDLCEALKTAVSLQGEGNMPFNVDDPIYKAAEFIIHHIIEKFDGDLRDDAVTFDFVAERVRKFFDDSQAFVSFRATQIIASARETKKLATQPEVLDPKQGRRLTMLSKCVSFSKFSSTIGTSSYDIHPLTELKNVADRSPTPAGSLASIVVESCENPSPEAYAPHLTRDEAIFIEHFVIRFKHELIVGMGRRVFAAIQCHFDNNIMDVRKELLDMDREFLVTQMTNAILGYARNSLNFESAIKLCISSLSSNIIWSLQKHLLPPERDPRGIVKPCQCCVQDAENIHLCLYCER